MLSNATSVSVKACPSAAMTLPALSLSGPLIAAKPPLSDLGLRRVELGAGGVGDGGTEGRHLDEPFGKAAAHEVGDRLARHRGGDHVGIDLGPVPLRPGQVKLGGQRRLVGVVAADIGAASGGGFDHHLGAVDVASDDIATGVGERIGRLGLLHRKRPLAGEDHLAGDRRIDGACPEQEGVDVEQHLRDGLGRDESDLLGLAGMACGDAVEILAHADVAEVGADIGRMLPFGPHAAAMLEPDVGVGGGKSEDVGVEIAE